MPFFDPPVHDIALRPTRVRIRLPARRLAIRQRKSQCACTIFAHSAENPSKLLKEFVGSVHPMCKSRARTFIHANSCAPGAGWTNVRHSYTQHRNVKVVDAKSGETGFVSHLLEASSI